MASHWFCRVGDEEVGPVTFQEMAQMVRDGRLTEGDRVRREMSSEWVAARGVIGLFRAAASLPASPAAGPPASPAAGPPPAPPKPKEAPRRVARERSAPGDRRRDRPRWVWIGGFAVLVIAVVTVWRSRSTRIPPFPKSRTGAAAASRSLEPRPELKDFDPVGIWRSGPADYGLTYEFEFAADGTFHRRIAREDPWGLWWEGRWRRKGDSLHAKFTRGQPDGIGTVAIIDIKDPDTLAVSGSIVFNRRKTN